jgi:hypothetical protein
MLNHRYKSNCTWFMPVQSVFLALMLLATTPVWAASDAAMISDIQRGTTFKAFDRYNRSKKLGLYDVVQEGDRIRVFTGSITLMKAKVIDTIKAGETKEVRGSGPDDGMVTAIAKWFRGLLKAEREGTFLVSRGGQLKMWLLKQKTPRNLVAGKRELHFGWTGGESPFQVILKEKKPTKAYKEIKEIKVKALTREKETTSVTLTTYNFLAKHRYRIQVIDARNNKIEGVFSVVAKKDLPKFSPISKHSPPKVRESYAVFLKNHGKKWIFEAYQHVADIKNSSVGKVLKEGRKVKKVKVD